MPVGAAAPEAACVRALLPTRRISAAATPSGYGSGLLTTIRWRRGMENITPSIPPAAQIASVCQNGKCCQCPSITSDGRMKMMDDRVPAADAWVCTILFSRMLAPGNMRRTDIEITAAGMAEEKVSPTFKPRKTLEAVKTTVMAAPSKTPRTVNSGKDIASGTRNPSAIDTLRVSPTGKRRLPTMVAPGGGGAVSEGNGNPDSSIFLCQTGGRRQAMLPRPVPPRRFRSPMLGTRI